MSAVHPLHSICPYFAMFPPQFVEKFVLSYTSPGDIVFDPFSGRGTTIFESLLLGRPAYGLDINPVAACISGAKADPPTPEAVKRRIRQIQAEFATANHISVPEEEFFKYCFSGMTLKQICFLRSRLEWKHRKVDRFVAAMALGCLHGESHRSRNCFSNRMPRTISTKPEYSVRWWIRNNSNPPVRDVFEILLDQVPFRYKHGVPHCKGSAKLGDARSAARSIRKIRGKVRLLLTSPPYLDTTDYGEDQWLRLWFLGGENRPKRGLFKDARHSCARSYWSFLREAWQGQQTLLSNNATVVVRIGGTRLSVEDIENNLTSSLEEGFTRFDIKRVGRPESSEIRRRQTNVFRPGTSGDRAEHDFVFRLERR